MTLNEAITIAPAIAATRPAPRCSARYQFIPTLRVLEPLLQRGWEIHRAQQNDADDPFAMHSVTLVHRDNERSLVGQLRPTATLFNSHNCTRRLTASVGLYVCVCNNQLHVEMVSQQFERIRLTGGGLDTDRLADLMLAKQTCVISDVAQMRAKQLDEVQQLHLAKRGVALADRLINIDFVDRDRAEPLLVPQRESQRDDRSLWTTLNVVQENLIERGRRGRGIHEILRNSNVNLGLWNAAQQMLTA